MYTRMFLRRSAKLKKRPEGMGLHWFWYFGIYSFLGFVLEVAFARLTGNPKRDRKCRYFLPFCPVYGFGALALILLPEVVRDSLPLLFLCAAAACTAVEYATDLFYERVAGVRFWNYAHLPLNLGGRVCLLFALFWGVLALLLQCFLHPRVAALTALIPDWLFLPAAAINTLDLVWTLAVLRRTRSTDALRWYLRPRRRVA